MTKAAKTKATKKAESPKPTKQLVTVKPSAISADVGPAVVAGLYKADQEAEKAQQALHAVDAKRYDLLAMTTEAIVKAARVDDSVDLSASFAEDKAKMNKLMLQVNLALGLREVKTDAKGKAHVVVAKSVEKFFPSKKDDPKDPATARKQTFRTNFAHLLKKCVQAAHTITSKNIEHKVDSKSGTLLLSGPVIEKEFGQPSILLNEKQVTPHGKLEQKPSYTAIAALSAPREQKGKVGRRGVGGAVSSAADPEEAVVSICKSLMSVLEKLDPKKPLSQSAHNAIVNLRTAIDPYL